MGVRVPLSAQRSLFEGLLFRCPFGANKCKLIVYHRFAKVSAKGWCRDRAHFFKTYGFEGEYWGSYMGRFEKLEPGIYKVVVVGVDAKTGEYNSVVAFSEPFKTEEY